MKFSIVTISYNQARFLEQAILSVLNQDYPDVEYIVVDPGSTDGSREIIEKYRDRIDKIIFEPDNGPADGLNKGFAQATGDVFGFINSDDYLLGGALNYIADAFCQNPLADVISGHGLIVDKNGKPRRRIYSDRFNLKMAAYGACILIQPSTFFRSDIFRKAVGFNIDNHSNWDGELFVDMALCGARFATIGHVISAYRVHPGSITGSAKLIELHKKHREKMFKKIMKRSPGKHDEIVARLLNYLRKIMNPKDTIERVLRGPIFGVSK